jgi:hypothetical protein
MPGKKINKSTIITISSGITFGLAGFYDRSHLLPVHEIHNYLHFQFMKIKTVSALTAAMFFSASSLVQAASTGTIYTVDQGACTGSSEAGGTTNNLSCSVIRILDNRPNPNDYAEYRFALTNGVTLIFIGLVGGVQVKDGVTETKIVELRMKKEGQEPVKLDGEGGCMEQNNNVACAYIGNLSEGKAMIKISAKNLKFYQNVKYD